MPHLIPLCHVKEQIPSHKEILLEFLRDLFPDKRIEDIAYLNNENQGLSEADRKSVFDVEKRKTILKLQVLFYQLDCYPV